MTEGAWGKGSTRAWRKLRLEVLDRDRWVCQLCGNPISRNLKFPDPKSASVHHTKGKRDGDNPDDLVAAHLDCNQHAGTLPTITPDPEPTPSTDWS